ncbi:MAG: esterase family protein, partial [bacterium]|nr:esterase family protein [bacterium]
MNRKYLNIFKVSLLFVSILFLIYCPCPSPNLENVQRGLSYSSQYLDQVLYTIYLPPDYNVNLSKRFPVLYLLHGGMSKHDTHVCKLNLTRAMKRLSENGQVGSMIVVMPNGDKGWWVNRKDGNKSYESFLIDELIPYIDSTYRTKPGRRYRAIGGISMGGYGSISLSFRHLTLFKAVAATSPVFLVNINDAGRFPFFNFGGAFGVPFDPAYYLERDPLSLAGSIPRDQLETLAIYFDRGDSDHFGAIPACEALSKALTSRSIEYVFKTFPGGHNKIYFKEHLDDVLLFIWDA